MGAIAALNALSALNARTLKVSDYDGLRDVAELPKYG
jgi:hypothetical protein